MSDMTRQLLLESNFDLLREVERLIVIVNHLTPITELKEYHQVVYQACQKLSIEIENNLDAVRNRPVTSFETLLSETQRLNTELIFYNQHFIGPLCRSVPEDRLPLRILRWLYKTHAVTRDIPVALTNSGFKIWPETDKPTLYGVPVSAQQSLLNLPLLFHEFGHQLFACFSDELNKYIRDLQQEIENLLIPWSQGSDKHADRDRSRRKDIVGTWYAWCEELFCDAVGLNLGGPAFLYALDRYVRLSDRTEYYAPRSTLSYREHPIFRLRMKLLVHQAESFGCSTVANLIKQNWTTLAAVHQAKEDYFGFFEESYFPIIQEALQRMVQEVGPYHFTDQDLSSSEWAPGSTPVHLLNRAWTLYITAVDDYTDWEREMILRFCAN